MPDTPRPAEDNPDKQERPAESIDDGDLESALSDLIAETVADQHKDAPAQHQDEDAPAQFEEAPDQPQDAPAQAGGLADVLAQIDSTIDTSVDRLFDLLRIPSISTDPAHRHDCQKAADWLVSELTSLGFTASARPTEGQPMVVAHWEGPIVGAGGPDVLFYGHYDVQPPDPLDLWETEPFEPRIADGADGKIIVARGASDDKGQLMTFIEACRGWITHAGGLPTRVSILFEGEEESGSPSLDAFLGENRDELSKDVALVCDTGMWDARTPAVTTMLRGMVYEQVTIKAANRDLHSGMYGGAARNPIRVLTRILGQLHDPTGRVTIPGFYDGVGELPEAIKTQWMRLGFDAIGFLGEVGLAVPAGETDRSVLEQIWARPTCDVNGIYGGYTGAGSKTVIPAEASAKISFRLVGNQNPEAVSEAFRAFVEERLPADCTAEFINLGLSPALALPLDSPHLDRTRAALTEEFGREAVLLGSGGSIPIVGDFKRMLGMDSLLVGFALDSDQIHSPNEKYNLASYHHGIRSWARILEGLAA